MLINTYEPVGQGRSKVINYGQYQRQGPGNIDKRPKELPKDETELSPENKKLADNLTRLTLQVFKIKTDGKELDKDAKQISKGLDYFI